LRDSLAEVEIEEGKLVDASFALMTGLMEYVMN